MTRDEAEQALAEQMREASEMHSSHPLIYAACAKVAAGAIQRVTIETNKRWVRMQLSGEPKTISVSTVPWDAVKREDKP